MACLKLTPTQPTREMSQITKDLGEVIKNLRLESGLSQEQMGGLCGLDRTYIGIIERGGKAITVETAERIARGLGVKLSSIFGRVEALREDRDSYGK